MSNAVSTMAWAEGSLGLRVWLRVWLRVCKWNTFAACQATTVSNGTPGGDAERLLCGFGIHRTKLVLD